MFLLIKVGVQLAPKVLYELRANKVHPNSQASYRVRLSTFLKLTHLNLAFILPFQEEVMYTHLQCFPRYRFLIYMSVPPLVYQISIVLLFL